ncbi:MAG: aquaporin [Candidatus Saccharimonadales bacterium]
MATKKATTAKKSTRAKSQPVKKTVTTVTTVKAVEASSAKTTSRTLTGDRRTLLAAALIGEFIGTFLLTSAFLVAQGNPLYMSFAVVGIILMVGTLSGAYLNPLLTVGAWVTRKLSHLRALAYVVAQLLGAGAAFVVLTSFIDGSAGLAVSSQTAQAPELYKFVTLSDKNQWFVFFAELLGATVLAFAFAGALRERTDHVAKALTIGFSVLVAYMIFSTTASWLSGNVALNPAIALAAQAIDWSKINWGAIVAYFAAPLIGGIIGFVLRDVVETK